MPEAHPMRLSAEPEEGATPAELNGKLPADEPERKDTEAPPARAGRRLLALLGSDLALAVYALAAIIVVWAIAQRWTKFMPTPLEVVNAIPDFVSEENVLGSALVTLQRVLIGMAIGTAAALVAVAIAARSKFAASVIATYIYLGLSLPSIAAALFSLMVFGLSSAGVYSVVAVITFPFVALGIQSGMKSVDGTLVEMSRVYELSTWERQRHVYLPQIAPALLAAVRNAHALGWKVAIVAEVVLNRDGLGRQFQSAADDFSLAYIVLWLVVFVAIFAIVEYAVLGTWERHLYRWRQRNEFKAGTT